MSKIRRLAVTGLLVLCAASTQAATKKNADIGIVSKGTIDGEEIYRVTCSVCHGERGDGQSFAAKALNPPPRDFTDTDVIRYLTREDMINTTRDGRPKTAMQPFDEQLNKKQIDAVIAYIRSNFMKLDIPEETKKPDILVGRGVYNYRCYMCHGYGGDARTQAGATLKPKPRSFTDAKRMRTLSTSTMMDAVKNGRPGTAMQPFATILNDHEIASVVAFIRYAFVDEKAGNIRYHSPNNGWSDFQRKYTSSIAYFFHEGSEDELSPDQEWGKRVFEISCVSCHLHKTDNRGEASVLTWSSVSGARAPD